MLRTKLQVIDLLKNMEIEAKIPVKGKDSIIVWPMVRQLEFNAEITRIAWTNLKSDSTGERLYRITFENT
jgi:hypothetical protein